MFNLIRRISNGVILRPDRPWADDATSNAPTKGKKRRNPDAGSTEETKTKKIRGEIDAPETSTSTPTPQPELEPELERQRQEEKEVKEVTKGVKEVELNESRSSSSASGSKEEVKPESVPLPGEDDVEELEESADATVSPSIEAASDDVASSVDGEVADGPSEPEPALALKGQENASEGVEKKTEAEVPENEKETKKTEATPAQ